MTRYALRDGNVKLGRRTLTTLASPQTCPSSCPLRERGCYAHNLRGLLRWGREGLTFAQARAAILRPRNMERPLRLHVAGDLRDGADVDRWALVAAQRRGFSWTYTHRRFHPKRLWRASMDGLTINVSADGLAEADRMLRRYAGAAPVSATVPMDAPRTGYTPAGARYVVCPAQCGPVTCATCGNGVPLCARAVRSYIVAFRAHGKSARRLSEELR